MFSRLFLLFLCFLVNQYTGLSETDLDWWQTSVVYQIYPKSFKDSNGDGVGDLKGIEQMVDYFAETGIEVIWLSPIYKSPMADAGYDVSSFTEIDPSFGTMEDFDSLLQKCKSMNIKVVLDFVPNHSSDECIWFKLSINKTEPYTDYYVWRDPKEWKTNGTIPIPPNNWVSVFGGSAWEYNAARKQYYLHEFLPQQPDFNYRSPKLVEEMMNILKFWLEKGVDGFRVDSIMYLYEDKNFLDEPLSSKMAPGVALTYNSLNHTYTINQPETYEMTFEFRALLDSYKKKDGHTRLLMTEAYTNLQNTLQYYGNSTKPGAHIPFNFFLIDNLDFSSNALAYNTTINNWIKDMPQGTWANWVLGNHDNPRVTQRFGSELADGLNMLLLLLPGTAVTYNGEELAMENTKIRFDQTDDKSAMKLGPLLYSTVSRDPERTPFQWNATLHAGFSNTTDTTWLPVNPNYYNLNLEKQKNSSSSHWKLYRDLVKLRKSDVFLRGDFSTHVVSEWVFAFKRSLINEELFVVVLNLNNEEEIVDLGSKIPNLPTPLEVYLTSMNSEYAVGDKINVDNEDIKKDNGLMEKSKLAKKGFKMRPNSALVLRASIKKVEPAKYSSGADSMQFGSLVPVLLVVLSSYFLKLFRSLVC